MRVIRHGVFETASSSVHSVSIDKRNKEDWPKVGLKPNASGALRIEGGEFGWGPDEYTDAYTKASYAWTYLLETNQSSGPLRDMLEEVLKEHTGARYIELMEPRRGKGGWMEDCYIDHQALEEPGVVGEEVFASKDTLATFIFGNSTLVIDSDNH